MTKDMIQFENSLQALAQLVALCKRDQLVRELANRLDLRRQTVYLWDSPDCNLSNRAAKLRLLEISRLPGAVLAPIALFAKEAVEALEAQEDVGREGLR